MLSSVQAAGVSTGGSVTVGLLQGSSVSCLTMFNIMFNGFSTGVLLGDGVQSNDDVCKMKINNPHRILKHTTLIVFIYKVLEGVGKAVNAYITKVLTRMVFSTITIQPKTINTP